MPRTIRESNDTEIEINAAINTGRYPRFEELWEGWKWRLAHNPEIDSVKFGRNTQLIRSADLTSYELPSGMTMLYTFDEDYVDIISIRIV